MDDSLKGLLVTVTIIGLFITSIINFTILFPLEQGVVFTGQDNDGYLTLNNSILRDTNTNLQALDNQSTNAYNEWDVTTGFMGTNQIKQGQGGLKNQITSTFSNINTMRKVLFGDESNSAIKYAILTMSTLAFVYLTYSLYQFVRTGR